MKARSNTHIVSHARRRAGAILSLIIAACVLRPTPAHASMFHGETLDALANGLSWVVLVLVPVVAITVFWLLHIMPEKIAHKKRHPQTKAIQCLCLLSLFFGGILWPLAWIWAYTKPVMHKLAYGTDVDDSHGDAHATDGHVDDGHAPDENAQLRLRVAELESQLSRKGVV